MSQENNGFDSPSDEKLRAIRMALPGLREEAAKKSQASALKKSGIKPGDKLCAVCGEVIKISGKNPGKQCCGICQGRLNNGEIALITLDGRHIFGVFDEVTLGQIMAMGRVNVDVAGEQKQIAGEVIEDMEGKIIGIMPALMDLLIKKFEEQSASN